MADSEEAESDRNEREIKIRLDDVRACVEAILELGATVVEGPMVEDDRLYDDAQSRLAEADLVLRLRRQRDLAPGSRPRALLTYKGPGRVESGLRVREEIETRVEDGDALELLLERLGYAPRFRYQKRRQLFRLEGSLLAVDETALGAFLEIEGGGAEAIARIAKALGHSEADYLTASYPALWREQDPEGDMLLPELDS